MGDGENCKFMARFVRQYGLVDMISFHDINCFFETQSKPVSNRNSGHTTI